MKKGIIISMIAILSLLTSCSKPKRVLDNIEGTFLQNECTKYFYNLNNDYPINVKGSCGYVAASMLLRYYDFIYDNDIIDSKYEENNGLKRENYNKIKDLNNSEYLDFLKNTQDDYFHSYLIVNSCEKYPIYKPASKIPFITYHGSNSRIPEYYSEVHAIIDNYLYNIKDYNRKLKLLELKITLEMKW